MWSGVLFIREGEVYKTDQCGIRSDISPGPYKGAVLRFQISFPYPFPSSAPLITFSSEVFHPLLTPLTTYTYTTSASDADTVSATDHERLPPGGFSLRHGFPQWFGRERKASLDSSKSPRPGEKSSLGSSTAPRPILDVTMYDVLEYMRKAFSSEELLDSITLGAAANPGAYHAYRSFRGKTSPAQSRTTSPEPSTSRARRPGEWNWEGVWEERVRRGVQSTLAESVLFGGAGTGDDMVSALHLPILTEVDGNLDAIQRDPGRCDSAHQGSNASILRQNTTVVVPAISTPYGRVGLSCPCGVTTALALWLIHSVFKAPSTKFLGERQVRHARITATSSACIHRNRSLPQHHHHQPPTACSATRTRQTGSPSDSSQVFWF